MRFQQFGDLGQQYRRHQRLVALDVDLRWSRYMLLGLAVAPVTVALATLALAYQ